jgi:RND superfamily putative drug exporter
MELLGQWTWWFPRWLDRLVPRLDVEGGHIPDRRTAPAFGEAD